MSLALDNREASVALTDQQQYRLLFAATFVVFLAAAATVRLYHLARGRSRQTAARRSLFQEARATGYSTLALAFMG